MMLLGLILLSVLIILIFFIRSKYRAKRHKTIQTFENKFGLKRKWIETGRGNLELHGEIKGYEIRIIEPGKKSGSNKRSGGIIIEIVNPGFDFRFCITEQHFLSSLLPNYGADIEFHNEKLDKNFVLSSTDEFKFRKIITPRLIDLLNNNRGLFTNCSLQNDGVTIRFYLLTNKIMSLGTNRLNQQIAFMVNFCILAKK
jgi:hypothetical protein